MVPLMRATYVALPTSRTANTRIMAVVPHDHLEAVRSLPFVGAASVFRGVFLATINGVEIKVLRR